MLRRALSLVEVVVAVGFLAISLILVLGLLPSGILSLKQAECLQTATSLGLRLIEEAPAPGETAPPGETLTYRLNGTVYRCERSYRLEGPMLFDVVVRVNYDGARRPLEFWLRKDRRA
ncbi:MAG: hypothetical protein AB1758_09315 [Candidatus Eremiobacterota bacterium]